MVCVSRQLRFVQTSPGCDLGWFGSGLVGGVPGGSDHALRVLDLALLLASYDGPGWLPAHRPTVETPVGKIRSVGILPELDG